MRKQLQRAKGLLAAALVGGILASLAAHSAEAPVTPAAPARIEARSATMLAVGLVNDDRMRIHLSQMLDNAPIRDAVVTVSLRGVIHPTLSEADGSYSMQSADLRLPGAAAIEMHIVQGAAHENLKGMLQVTDGGVKEAEPNSARQLGWWVLNFAVCIGFLMLWSRRKKTAVES